MACARVCSGVYWGGEDGRIPLQTRMGVSRRETRGSRVPHGTGFLHSSSLSFCVWSEGEGQK